MQRFRQLSILSIVCLGLLTGCAGSDSPSTGKEGAKQSCQKDTDCKVGYTCDLETNTCQKSSVTPDTKTGGDTNANNANNTPEPDAGTTNNNNNTNDTFTPPDTIPDPSDTGGGGDDTTDDPDHECQTNSDCDDNQNCVLQDGLRVCKQVSTPDAGATDTTDTSDPTDTDEDTGGGSDIGPGNFSGCSADSDCASYQTCNTNLGRCEDSRPKCTEDADCQTQGAVCLLDRCLQPCTDLTPNNNDDQQFTCDDDKLTCLGLQGTDTPVCASICDRQSSSELPECATDTQCVPFGGENLGFCRGTGVNTSGESCDADFSENACESGSYCRSIRNTDECKSLCYPSDSDPCQSGQWCNDIFSDLDGDDQDTPAGVCTANCGGIGSTDNSVCSGNKKCQPISGDRGICIEEGTAGTGDSCQFENGPYCQAGDLCMSTGPDAPLGNADGGTCTSLCNPNASSSDCGSDKACSTISSDGDIGSCKATCDPKASSNSCPSGQPRCLPTPTDGNASAAGVCEIAGPSSKTTGSQCDFSSILSCNAENTCVAPNAPFGFGQDPDQGVCKKSCVAFDNPGQQSQCGSGEACAAFISFTSKIGFCSSDTTSSGTAVGDSCSTGEIGLWCSDSVLCNDWNSDSTTATCRIPCGKGTDSTCPSGQTCNAPAGAEDGALGYCE